MKRKQIVAVGMAVIFAAGAVGCGNYKKVEVTTETVSEPVETGAETPAADLTEKNVSAVGIATREETTAQVSETTVSKVITAMTKAAVEDVIQYETCDETVYVVTDQLNIREQPNTNSQVEAVAHTGDELKRTGVSDTWSRVEYSGKTCYVASKYVSTEKPKVPETTSAQQTQAQTQTGAVSLNTDWKYAGFSKINSGQAMLYKTTAANKKGKVVCVNAGHGTKGGESVKTQCHPDGTPKVTGGTTGAGATSAIAVSGGMTFADGTPERKVTLAMALALKEKLLARGYDVLMIRESEDVQLDNIARTVIANNMANCHIALHWDSTSSNKGAFYMSVPNNNSYRGMEPVASHWKEHNALGNSLIAGLKGAGVKIFSGGSMEMDLTQTSYSTVPSVDVELGDKVSDHSAAALDKLAAGLADGVDQFFGN